MHAESVSRWCRLGWPLIVLGTFSAPASITPTVELEEDVYTYEPANNGAGPLWCQGSTCLVRIGDERIVSGLETLAEAEPLNNCRWVLFRRRAAGWERVTADPVERTREPCPIAGFPNGRLFLSANPTLEPDPKTYSGPSRPLILEFALPDPRQPQRTLIPEWSGEPSFTEHSYRSFAADGTAGELILLQNVGYTHAEWSFLDRTGHWSAKGQLKWPWGADYAKPQPIRVCYPNVALHNRAVYFCGVSDIVEPNPAWRTFKQELTGREWDYDFRRLFYTWTPDITREGFRDWIEITSRESTCGWITPGDLHVTEDGTVHLLWTERALDERLRAEFFPDARQRHALEYAQVRNDQIVHRRTLFEALEGTTREQPGRGRFQVTPEGRLFVFFYVHGTDPKERSVSENRLLEIHRDGSPGEPVTLPFQRPFTDFFTATVRGGSPPSWCLELLGVRAGSPHTISYARVRLQQQERADP